MSSVDVYEFVWVCMHACALLERLCAGTVDSASARLGELDERVKRLSEVREPLHLASCILHVSWCMLLGELAEGVKHLSEVQLDTDLGCMCC